MYWYTGNVKNPFVDDKEDHGNYGLAECHSAEAEKYDLIVQEAVYFSPRIDITDKVIKALGDGAQAK